MKILNSQDLKDIFNDKNNKKEYPVFVYTSYNKYPIENVIMADGEIIIITKEIGGELVNDGKEEAQEIDTGPMIA